MELTVLDGAVAIDESHVAEPADEVRGRIDEYERGERRAFDLSVEFPDSFAGRVMQEMVEVPYGETRTYGDLATDLETAPIAVGRACGLNSVPIVVPCHRIVASDGSMRGYSEPGGVALKRRLLAHERRVVGGA